MSQAETVRSSEQQALKKSVQECAVKATDYFTTSENLISNKIDKHLKSSVFNILLKSASRFLMHAEKHRSKHIFTSSRKPEHKRKKLVK